VPFCHVKDRGPDAKAAECPNSADAQDNFLFSATPIPAIKVGGDVPVFLRFSTVLVSSNEQRNQPT